MSRKLLREIKFNNPGIYHIKVLGIIRHELLEHFSGEIGHNEENLNGRKITSLKIHVLDQAELSGLINMLYDWRLVLLSVNMEGLLEDTVPGQNQIVKEDK